MLGCREVVGGSGGKGKRVKLELTAVFRKVKEGYIGFVEELPGANTQAPTLHEARESLREAALLGLGANGALAEEERTGQEVIREPLGIAGA